ncbi:uncharacterized protein KQ657_000660 [Scheffersomyces spartinae]|uniref:Aminopeptidase n=1 Tax=Scheffersomyces spartinae TaxID=45513 RepID=A0A9P8AIE8_9ASCO|nr:uncharacterized protein KQ657_000660 [Scheffersomyces spartinae]KAG7193589.1 hypothetical protein KQ657_000660 [Scheffersomyces spartinae]
MTETYYESLPTFLRPTHYQLVVHDIEVEKDTFSGEVKISFDVTNNTKQVHVNYRDLKIKDATIHVADGSIIPLESLDENKSKEYCVLNFTQELIAGQAGVVCHIKYDGRIHSNMAGLYKSLYNEEDETKWMLSTQFEATDARRTFPCLDEPALKATFDLELHVPKQWTALANTPVESISELESANVYKFERTPIMSTYLVAWACGDFEYVESFTEGLYHDNKPLPVRIYTTKGGYIKDAQLALEIAPKIIDYFSKVFDIKYPLKKLDLIAVHSFSHNAMENWGLITYRSTALLYNEAKSEPSYKQKVAYVVAHELAHQWFGNLVTMKWWDELWLNEGFATWVGFTAVDYLYPEWDIFSKFVSESLQQALTLDGLRSSHPIEVPVKDALDIDQVFDEISYLKGASTILMLSKYLGTELFLKGVANYLKKHQFSNATTHDLWLSVQEVSGKPVVQMMESWIKKIGFPVISVDINDDDSKLTVSQSRFLNGGDVTEDENLVTWWVPLNPNSKTLELDALEEKSVEISLTSEQKLLKLNKDTSGAYRVNYSSELLDKHIHPYLNELLPTDLVGLIADSAAMARGDYNSTVTLLKLLKSSAAETTDAYVFWLELSKILSNLKTVFIDEDDEELSKGLKAFVKSIYEPEALKLLNELKTNETQTNDFLRVNLRSLVLTAAGLNGIEPVIDYAYELFSKWSETGVIDPSFRLFIFTVVASSSEKFSNSKFDLIMKEVTNPSSLDSREVALSALGHTVDPEFSAILLGLLLKTDTIPVMDSHFLGIQMSKNTATRRAFWNFFKENYQSFYEVMSSNMVVLDRFIKFTLGNYQSMEMYQEVEQLFKDKDVHGFEFSYKQSLDRIKINAVWREGHKEEVKEWLKANGYY